jgi:hypothetical protein
MLEAADEILHHDDRGVHEQAKISAPRLIRFADTLNRRIAKREQQRAE